MVAEIEADMADQLERVREMERRGERAAIPRGQASVHCIRFFGFYAQ